MNFEPKISGTKVTGFTMEPLFCSQVVTLKKCIEKVHRQETMNYILDTFRFIKSGNCGEWYMIIDHDTDYKLAVMENYPEYEDEFKKHFGEDWIKHYIRFNH